MATLVSLGALGLIAAIWVVWGAAFKLIRAARKHREGPEADLVAACALSCAGFGASMLFFDAFAFVQATLVFFIIAAVGLRAPPARARSRAGHPARRTPRRPSNDDRRFWDEAASSPCGGSRARRARHGRLCARCKRDRLAYGDRAAAGERHGQLGRHGRVLERETAPSTRSDPAPEVTSPSIPPGATFEQMYDGSAGNYNFVSRSAGGTTQVRSSLRSSGDVTLKASAAIVRLRQVRDALRQRPRIPALR